MVPCRDCGRCPIFLALALLLDAVGLALVLAGAAGQPTLDGQPFQDFLVLSGALLLFLSLLCWLFWYSGNLRGVPAEELPLGARAPAAPAHRRPKARDSLLRLAAKLSIRLSQRRSASSAPAPSSAGPLEMGRLRPAAQTQTGAPAERLV
ncbi:transmembrane protein 238-like [Anolis carolinensis]|uniref:transmembrane protein 238-like n=1 Tax=Anolis carolinensis TaxID=28377 RepID=UPI002F2B1595